MNDKMPSPAFERGRQDYLQSNDQCPYPPNSKRAKKWKEGYKTEETRSIEDAGGFDDGGAI